MFRATEERSSRTPDGASPIGDILRGVRRSARAWARNTFNRDQMVSGLKSLAWVAPLSVLIWIYAERQQTRPAERRAIPFQIRTNNPRQIVTVIRPSERVIQADLKGPQSALENVIRQLDPSGGQNGAEIVLPDTLTGDSEREVSVPTSSIRNAAIFRDGGVSVSNELPATLLVKVDQLVDVELEVQPPQGMENFVSPPQFEPRRVRVTGPRSELQKLGPGEQLVVYAELGRYDSIRTPGPQVLKDVPLSLNIRNDAGNITLSAERVIATVDIKNAERELKIDSLAIWPLYPPGVQGKFVAKMDAEFVQNVVVTGPRDLIDQIAAGTLEPRPKAILDIDPGDVNKGPQQRKLRFDLPAGVKVSPQSANRSTVTFSLVDRNAPEP